MIGDKLFRNIANKAHVVSYKIFICFILELDKTLLGDDKLRYLFLK